MCRVIVSVFFSLLLFIGNNVVSAKSISSFESPKNSNLHEFYVGNDGGAFYVFSKKKKIRWFAEHPGKNYSHTFWGKKEGDRIKGTWWSMPKYGDTRNGTVEMEVQDNNSIRVVNESGGFPTSSLKPSVLTDQIQRQLPYKKLPEWSKDNTKSLTGAFKSRQKNVVCYSRQKGRVVRMFCESEAGGVKKPTYSYMFLGQKKAGKIDGKVFALSKGKQKGGSKVTYFITSDSKLNSESEFDLGGKSWKRIYPDHKKKINRYIASRPNNAKKLLNTEDSPNNEPEAVGIRRNEPTKVSGGNKQCSVQEWKFSKNVVDQTVFNDIDVYPGALVKIDKNFIKNSPLPFTGLPLAKREVTLSLPGFSDGEESFKFNPISKADYTEGFNNAHQWWIRHNSKFTPEGGLSESEASWSDEQMMMNLNVNYYGPGVNVGVGASHGTSKQKYTFYALAKYKFYSATVTAPSSPAEWFARHVSLKDVKNIIKNDVRLGYVNKVTYGALRLIKFEFDRDYSFTEVEAVVDAVTSGGAVSTDLEVSHNKVLKNVKIRYLASGGKMKPVDHNGDMESIIEQFNIIENEIVSNSDPNTGVPISYEINFLKDKEPAKVGMSIAYESEQCTVTPDYISVRVSGHFVTAFRLTDATGKLVKEEILTQGESKKIPIPVSSSPSYKLEIKNRSWVKGKKSKGGWSFYDQIDPVELGCQYRMGGTSKKKANLSLERC